VPEPPPYELVLRYAQAADRRRPDVAAALFTPDGELLITDPGREHPDRHWTGRPAIARVLGGLARYRTTTHHVTNHLARVGDTGATAETYCLAHHLDDTGVMVMSIRYADTFRRASDGWLFARRHLHVDWVEHRPTLT
jgi:hypothetical protein